MKSRRITCKTRTNVASRTVFRGVVHLISLKKYQYARTLLIYGLTIKKIYRYDQNRAWYLIGLSFFEQKKYYHAARSFKNALSIIPDDYLSLHLLGESDLMIGHRMQAFRAYYAGFRITKEPEYLYNSANALYDQRYYAWSISLYKKIHTKSSVYKFAMKNVRLAKERMKFEQDFLGK